MKNKSIKVNMLIKLLNTVLGIVFSLVTFPYASKVLGVDNVGKYTFSLSIVLYISLIADLGINTYAIRECSKYRTNKTIVTKLANEIFTINIISTAISLFLLFILVNTIDKIGQYKCIIYILSLSVVCKTISVEWIFSIFEDFFYITINSFIFQVIAIILLFLFVKTKDDLINYVAISVLASCSGIINFIYAHKYCNLKVTFHPHFCNHLIPILIIFGMNATITIYVASDTTILGFICDDKTVGIYYIASKIYTIAKTILSAVLLVSIPRLSNIWGKGERFKFLNLLSKIYKTLISFTIPVIVELLLFKTEIVLLVSDKDYLEASSALGLLGIALFFCMGSWFWSQCVLIVTGKERIVFIATFIGALTNIVLNFFIIPFLKEKAAALTTIIAEGITYLICMYYGRKIIKRLDIAKCVFKIIVGSALMIVTSAIFCCLISDILYRFIISSFTSFIVYILYEIIVKNEVFYDVYVTLCNKR